MKKTCLKSTWYRPIGRYRKQLLSMCISPDQAMSPHRAIPCAFQMCFFSLFNFESNLNFKLKYLKSEMIGNIEKMIYITYKPLFLSC